MTNPVFPELRAIDAIKPQDVARSAKRSRPASPASRLDPAADNVIGGTFCVMKTHGKTIDDMIVVAGIVDENGARRKSEADLQQQKSNAVDTHGIGRR
ncbi:MAG: hypothetical protein MZU97_18460 [Bacillus subtilis]|nr:hypothetical protein [Bacillus subtilis]